MRYVCQFAVLLLINAQLFAVETNEMASGDISHTTYNSDYGSVTVRAGIFPTNSYWDTRTDPPISPLSAVTAVRSMLPAMIDIENQLKWQLSRVLLINLGDFKGRGEWYYLVHFYNVRTIIKDGRALFVTKHLYAVVLLDGTVLMPVPEEVPKPSEDKRDGAQDI